MQVCSCLMMLPVSGFIHSKWSCRIFLLCRICHSCFAVCPPVLSERLCHSFLSSLSTVIISPQLSLCLVYIFSHPLLSHTSSLTNRYNVPVQAVFSNLSLRPWHERIMHLPSDNQTHDEQTGFASSICNKLFNTSSQIKQHEHTHGEWHCGTCTRTSHSEGDLNSHEKDKGRGPHQPRVSKGIYNHEKGYGSDDLLPSVNERAFETSDAFRLLSSPPFTRDEDFLRWL